MTSACNHDSSRLCELGSLKVLDHIVLWARHMSIKFFMTSLLTGRRTGVYVRVTGSVKPFNDALNVVAFDIHPIKDFNEITFHHLEAAFVHLETTRGPIVSFGSW